MTQSKSQEDRQFRARKEAQNPHGKIRSLKEIAKDTKKE
ncbi:DUF6254 family protein [Anaerobacillus alkaliphilus]|nr:DUF6254 family protein [Anaerobacillus alkaliphilus]